MKRVMIESPYKAISLDQFYANLGYARAATEDSLRRGEAPFAMHLFYPAFLHDGNPDERAQGIACGQQWLRAADLIAVYGDMGVSPGMKSSIELAQSLGIPIEYRLLGTDNA